MKKVNSNAIATFVLGILSILSIFSDWSSLVGLTLGIVGIFLGVQAKKQIAPDEEGRGIASAGLICSIIGTVLAALSMMTCLACAGAAIGAAACSSCLHY